MPPPGTGHCTSPPGARNLAVEPRSSTKRTSCLRLHTEGQRLPGEIPGQPDGTHERTVRSKTLGDGHLFLTDGFKGAEILDVRWMDIEHHRHIGRSQPGQWCDFAGMIGADLVDRGSRVSRCTHQRERHAEVVVEASRGGEAIDHRGRE